MRTIPLALLIALGMASAAPAAELVADYRFQDKTESNQPGLPAPALSYVTPNCGYVDEDVLGLGLGLQAVHSYCLGQGAAIPMGNVDAESWSIVVLARFVFADGYRRLLDTSDGTLDAGLYTAAGRLSFYPTATEASPSLSLGRYHQIAITRDGNTRRVRVYVDGAERLSFVDTGDVARIKGATARLFLDDSGENQSALVNRIRVWDGPLAAAEIERLTRIPDWQYPLVSVHNATVDDQNRIVVVGTGGSQPGDALATARDLPVAVTITDATGAVVDKGEAVVQPDTTWRYRSAVPLDRGVYAISTRQADEDRNSAVSGGTVTVARDAPTTPGGDAGAPGGEEAALAAAVQKTADTLGRWMTFLGEDALLSGVIARDFGSRAPSGQRAWLSFRAPVAGTLYVKVGRLGRKRCCADQLGWTAESFAAGAEREIALDEGAITRATRPAQAVEYWYEVGFKPRRGPLVQVGSDREVLTWKANCRFWPAGLPGKPECYAPPNPCRVKPARGRPAPDPATFNESCAEFERRDRIMNANRVARTRLPVKPTRPTRPTKPTKPTRPQ